MTIRLYDKDVDMLDFSAVVKTCMQRENGYVVTLDQTAFFPEGGGQGADHGTLGGVQVLDVGCGGGFPSVPLAILFPEAHFTAVDSIGKKIKVVQGVAEGLGLANLTPLCARAETLPERYDYVVSRAVTEMPTFVGWVWDKIDRGQKGALPNGILYLKGGDLADELSRTGMKWTEYPIPAFFDEAFFETKKVVYAAK